MGLSYDGSRALLANAFAHTFVVSAGLSALALLAALALVRQQHALSAQLAKGT